MIEINDTMKAAVVKVIYDSLTVEQRDKLLQDAVASLLVSYADKRSPLARIFDDCAFQVARQVVSDKLQNDPAFKEQVGLLYAEAFRRIFEEQRELTITKMANAISSALSEFRDR